MGLVKLSYVEVPELRAPIEFEYFFTTIMNIDTSGLNYHAISGQILFNSI